MAKCPFCKANMRKSKDYLVCTGCDAEGLQYSPDTVVATLITGTAAVERVLLKGTVRAYGPDCRAAADTVTQALQRVLGV